MSGAPVGGPRGWFLAVARAEGLSLLLLMGLAMPLKRLAGIPEPVSWIGWVHGMLVFVYLIALGSVRRVEGWSLLRCAAAFGASLVPFGTFAFERWLARAPGPTAGG